MFQQMPKGCPKDAQSLHKECPDFAQRTYEYICSNPYATIKEISEKLEIGERTVKNHIAALKEAGVIE